MENNSNTDGNTNDGAWTPECGRAPTEEESEQSRIRFENFTRNFFLNNGQLPDYFPTKPSEILHIVLNEKDKSRIDEIVELQEKTKALKKQPKVITISKTETKCPRCDKIYAKHDTMVKHLNTCPGKVNKTECSKCKGDFETVQKKNKHEKTCNGVPPPPSKELEDQERELEELLKNEAAVKPIPEDDIIRILQKVTRRELMVYLKYLGLVEGPIMQAFENADLIKKANSDKVAACNAASGSGGSGVGSVGSGDGIASGNEGAESGAGGVDKDAE